jgi:hypothetical protein
MKMIKHITAGARLVPISHILVYLFLVSMDLYTTYLASPDLKYEWNWIVRYFHLGWIQILILVPINSLMEIVLLYLGLSYTHSYYQKNRTVSDSRLLLRIFKNRKLVISLFLVGYFYNHLFYSIFLIINNYLSHLYINKIENIFSVLSDYYIRLEIQCGKYFLPMTYIISITITTIFMIFMVKRIGRSSHSIVKQTTTTKDAQQKIA